MICQRWMALLAAAWLAACDDRRPPYRPEDADTVGAQATFDATLPDGAAYKGPFPWHADDKVPDACQSLAADWDCMLPWPSDWYRQGGTHGKPRLTLGTVAAPKRAQDAAAGPGAPIDLLGLFEQDGFGVLGQIAVRLPGGPSDKGLMPAYVAGKVNPDFSPSQSPASLTLLLDAETGKAVAHFAEPDGTTPTPADRLLMLRPVERLREGRRYVVALRAGIARLDGTPFAPPAVFKALRDKAASPAADALRTHFEADVFAVLAKFGVPRDQLLLAWDFTTRSEANATGDMLTVRAKTLAWVASLPLEATLTKVIEDPKPLIARQFEGQLRVPLFVQGEGPGVKLVRDGAGTVIQNGTAWLPFTLIVPPKVWSGEVKGPLRIVQYGHGFFGTRNEVVVGVLPQLLDKMGAVGVGIDWWGMSLADSTQLVSDLIAAPDLALRFVQRAHQGMANHLALTWAVRNGLWQLVTPHRAGKALDVGKDVYFYGLSQGHILGGTQVALNPWIDKATLGVGGAGFGLMMSRAAPFSTFLALLTGLTGSPQGATRLSLLMTGPLERIDAGTYGTHLRTDTYPDSPSKRQVLLHCGLSDTQVPNLASHLHARILGVPLLAPSPRTVWGLPNVEGPVPDALVEFDFAKPALDVTGPAPDGGNPVHDAQRYLPASLEQIERFFRPGGKVEATCQGPCDPE